MNGNSQPLPQGNKNSLQSGRVILQANHFSGPLPPPEVLEKYEQIAPGTATKLVDLAVKQSEHRQSLEAKAINSDIINSKLGLIFGLAIGLAGLGGGVILGLKGMQASAVAISGTSLVSLVGVFIYGTEQRRRERDKRRQELLGK